MRNIALQLFVFLSFFAFTEAAEKAPQLSSAVFFESWNQFLDAMAIDRTKVGEADYLNTEFALIEDWGIEQYPRRRAVIPGMDDRDYRWVPYVENKVTLADGTEMSASYINFNSDAENDYQTFIASQAPLKGNVDLFWKMIWENGIEQIVMVTELTDNGIKSLCYPYWPEDYSSQLQLSNGMEIRVLNEKGILTEEEEYILKRQFSVIYDGEERIITHYWYRNWPDQTAPKQTLTLMTLIQEVAQDKKELGSTGPILAHCAGGVGRTGTFLVGYHLYQRMEKSAAFPALFDLVAHLRWQRPKMVSKPDQYAFCYRLYGDMSPTP